MSTRIHRAIGYAMPIKDFQKAYLFPFRVKNDSFIDDLEYILTPYQSLIYSGEDRVSRLIDGGRILDDKSQISDLVMLVGNGDDLDHVMFFPTAEIKSKWYRFDDDMDWVFAYREGDDPIASVFEYLPTMPLSVWSAERMNAAGERVTNPPENDFRDFLHDPNLIIGVPDILRFWLIRCGIMDLSGVAKLRPMRAQWWS